jgi:hypothetical protein
MTAKCMIIIYLVKLTQTQTGLSSAIRPRAVNRLTTETRQTRHHHWSAPASITISLAILATAAGSRRSPCSPPPRLLHSDGARVWTTPQGPAHQQRLTADFDASQQLVRAQPTAERLLAHSEPLHPGRLPGSLIAGAPCGQRVTGDFIRVLTTRSISER